MKLKSCLISICFVVLGSLVLLAQSVDGKWAGEVQGGRGPQPISLMLKAEGGKLTGTISGGRGGDVTIDEGTVSGNMIKFKSKQTGRGGEVVTNWMGTLKGDEIAMSRTAESGRAAGQAQEFTLKREK